MDDLIKTLKALSDATRIRIMKVLLERECCVCEIMQALDISQSRASRNLSILQGAGFLTARREGTWIIYSINRDSANHYAQSLAKMLEKLSFNNEILAQDKGRLTSAVRIGPGCVRNHRLSRK